MPAEKLHCRPLDPSERYACAKTQKSVVIDRVRGPGVIGEGYVLSPGNQWRYVYFQGKGSGPADIVLAQNAQAASGDILSLCLDQGMFPRLLARAEYLHRPSGWVSGV